MGEDLTLDDLIGRHRPGVEDDNTTRRALPATALHHPAQSTHAETLTSISNRQNGFHGRHRRTVRHGDSGGIPRCIHLGTTGGRRHWGRAPPKQDLTCAPLGEGPPAHEYGRPRSRPDNGFVFQEQTKPCWVRGVGQAPTQQDAAPAGGSPTEPAGAAARCPGCQSSPHNGVPDACSADQRGRTTQARRAR
jgi:hypothetical protein